MNETNPVVYFEIPVTDIGTSAHLLKIAIE